jgi:hypothetical protein
MQSLTLELVVLGRFQLELLQFPTSQSVEVAVAVVLAFQLRPQT